MTDQPKKRRRQRGSGSLFQIGRVWWICYKGADGKRVKESTGSTLKGAASTLLDSRNGSRIHRLPVVKNAEHVTFASAAQALKDEYQVNGRKSVTAIIRRIDKHLTPVFGQLRLLSITRADVEAYKTHRQKQGIVSKKGVRRSDVTNAQINRELQTLKRVFNLAIEQDRIAMKPKIKLLTESPARSGFFEPAQYESVVNHLPTELQPVIKFAYMTGWRIDSEVLPLQWHRSLSRPGRCDWTPGRRRTAKAACFR